MSNDRKLPIFLILALIILLLLLAGYYTYNEFLKTSNGNNCQVTNYKEFTKNMKNERVNEELKDMKNYRIKISSSGNVYVNSQIVETGVIKTFDVKADQSNVCAGNNRLVFIKEDGTVSALDIDMLDCANEIKMITDFGKLRNVTKVYYKEVIAATEETPAKYFVYAIDIDKKITDITSYLIK